MENESDYEEIHDEVEIKKTQKESKLRDKKKLIVILEHAYDIF